MLTDRNIHNYKKLEVSESQEAQLKAFYNQLRSISKTIEKDSITPLNNLVIVKVTSPKSQILVGITNDADNIEIWRVSEQVKRQKPEIQEGMNCFVPLIDGISRPCYYEEDNLNEYVYISVSAEQLIYAYRKQVPVDLTTDNLLDFTRAE